MHHSELSRSTIRY